MSSEGEPLRRIVLVNRVTVPTGYCGPLYKRLGFSYALDSSLPPFAQQQVTSHALSPSTVTHDLDFSMIISRQSSAS